MSEISINLPDRNNIKITLIYRSPNQPDEQQDIASINAIINTMSRRAADAVILGDLNLPEVDYDQTTTCTYPGISNKDRSKNYIDNIFNLKYVNHVTEPTLIRLIDRVKAGEFRHTPIHDVVLANCINVIRNVEVSNGIAKSDNATVKFEINATKSIPSAEKTMITERPIGK